MLLGGSHLGFDFDCRPGIGAFLALLVLAEGFDQGELLLAVEVGSQGRATEIGLEGHAAEVLLLVALADGVLVVDDVVASEGEGGARHAAFEGVIVALEGSLECAHYFGLLSLEAQLDDGLLHCEAEIGLLEDVGHAIAHLLLTINYSSH